MGTNGTLDTGGIPVSEGDSASVEFNSQVHPNITHKRGKNQSKSE